MQTTKKGSKFTFDNFELTKTNSKAYEEARHFAENADAKPLAIYGGTATGKTHLLYAVKNAIEKDFPGQNVVLTTTADMVSSLENDLGEGGSSKQFREKYLQADVLLADDIQCIAGKPRIQEDLILLFDEFIASGKRFMMTSSQKEAHFGIDERLVIRGFWGEFAVISKAYIHARLPKDTERDKMREALLKEGEELVYDFDLERFKTYFKNAWEYFMRYLGLFDMDRRDVGIINSLNDIKHQLICDDPLEDGECQACILFIDGILYTLSSYDIQMYRGGFSCNGILYIPLPHTAGTSDCMEVRIDEFDSEFQKEIEEYGEY